MAQSKKSGGFFEPVRRFFRLVGIVLLVLLGGVLFNLDRMDHVGVEILKYKGFLPKPVRIFLPGGRASDATAGAHEEIFGTMIEVYDGDTATLLAGEKKYKIRFYGIDAPEAAQTFGIQSRDALREKILGKELRVFAVNSDPYGRTVGKVFLGERYINREMVRDGMAWHYANYARRDYDLAEAQLTAQAQRRGLWNEDRPTPPWEYRHSK